MKNISAIAHVYARILDFSCGIYPTNDSPESILKGCAYLLKHKSIVDPQYRISVFQVLYLFSVLARKMRCFASTRVAYDLISNIFHDVLTEKQRETLDDDMMSIEVSESSGFT